MTIYTILSFNAASNYQEVIIHPAPYEEKEVVPLSQAVPNHVEQHRRIDRYEQRMVPGMYSP